MSTLSMGSLLTEGAASSKSWPSVLRGLAAAYALGSAFVRPALPPPGALRAEGLLLEMSESAARARVPRRRVSWTR